MDSFTEGYNYFEKSYGGMAAAHAGDTYIQDVQDCINQLKTDLNTFQGDRTPSPALSGFVSEFWHSDTFNINAAVNDSTHRTYVGVDERSTLGSPDILSNFGRDYGLKYYKTAEESAHQQAMSIFERYQKYVSGHGTKTLDEYLQENGFDNTEILLNDPLYKGQYRIIPKDQLDEAIRILKKRIAKERVTRPELVPKLEETLQNLTDRVDDGSGVTSVPLSKADANSLAERAKQGQITEKTLQELGISTEELIQFKHVFQQAYQAGITSATIAVVLRLAPEIYKCLSLLIKEGHVDGEELKNLGFVAIKGAAEGFFTGFLSAGITVACKSGLLGEGLKKVHPSLVGAGTVLLFHALQDSFKVSNGSITANEAANNFVKESFIITCSLIGAKIGQGLIKIPILGNLIGSFLGSVIGSFAYNFVDQVVLSFCIDTGFTVFGLVDQNYQLPDEVLKELGADVLEFDAFKYDLFKPSEMSFDTMSYDSFSYDRMCIDTLQVSVLRRGVIGVHEVGFIL